MSQDMTLVISQEEEEVINVVQEGGPQRRREISLKPGAGSQEISTRRGTIKVEARWEDNTLVVIREQERETPRRTINIKEEQVWELSDDGLTLSQKVKMDAGRRNFEGTLVFDKQ